MKPLLLLSTVINFLYVTIAYSISHSHSPNWVGHTVLREIAPDSWEALKAEYLFLHRNDGSRLMAFGLARMDNDEIILAAGWNDGVNPERVADKPVVAFSRDEGRTWSGFNTVPGAQGRPTLLTSLGNGEVMFVTDSMGQGLARQWYSKDYGKTWPESIQMQATVHGGGNTSGNHPGYLGGEGNLLLERDTQGKTSRIAQVGWNYDLGNKWPVDPANGIVRWSKDGGRTWYDEVVPPWKWQDTVDGKQYIRGVSEGSLIRANNGHLVAALRTDMPANYLVQPNDDSLDGLAISTSEDDGLSWSPLRVLFNAGRHHAHLLKLTDGRAVMTYIVRVDIGKESLLSYRRGLEAIVSHDGIEWDTNQRYILDQFTYLDPKAWYNGACGHLSSVQLKDGTILSAYSNYLTRGVSLIRWKPARKNAQPEAVSPSR